MSTPGTIGAQRENAAGSEPFLRWLDEWYAALEPLNLRQHLGQAEIGPERVAVASIDLVEGFCYEGPLSSPRVAEIVDAAANAFRLAYDLGVRNFAVIQEWHTHHAPEFDQFGPHCERGTRQAEMVAALRDLPFASSFALFHKNSIHPALGTGFGAWLDERPKIDTFIAVGDCTDLCIYQLVMYLKLRANAAGKTINVIVPEDCVQTYDVSVDVARQAGIMPHTGDLLHKVFLYHMALNGAAVVKSIV